MSPAAQSAWCWGWWVRRPCRRAGTAGPPTCGWHTDQEQCKPMTGCRVQGWAGCAGSVSAWVTSASARCACSEAWHVRPGITPRALRSPTHATQALTQPPKATHQVCTTLPAVPPRVRGAPKKWQVGLVVLMVRAYMAHALKLLHSAAQVAPGAAPETGMEPRAAASAGSLLVTHW